MAAAEPPRDERFATHHRRSHATPIGDSDRADAAARPSALRAPFRPRCHLRARGVSATAADAAGPARDARTSARASKCTGRRRSPRMSRHGSSRSSGWTPSRRATPSCSLASADARRWRHARPRAAGDDGDGLGGDDGPAGDGGAAARSAATRGGEISSARIYTTRATRRTMRRARSSSVRRATCARSGTVSAAPRRFPASARRLPRDSLRAPGGPAFTRDGALARLRAGFCQVSARDVVAVIGTVLGRAAPARATRTKKAGDIRVARCAVATRQPCCCRARTAWPARSVRRGSRAARRAARASPRIAASACSTPSRSRAAAAPDPCRFRRGRCRRARVHPRGRLPRCRCACAAVPSGASHRDHAFPAS